jgi:hypothetical protein
MNKQFRYSIIFLFIAISIGVGVYGYFQGWDTYVTHPGIDPELAPHMREIEAIEKLAESEPEAAEQRWEKLTEKLPGNISRWYKLGFKTAVTDVMFHGKVIDQYEAPVSGAKVSYIIVGQFLAAGAGKGFALTDEQGRFVIEGEGARVRIEDIIHPQINFNPPTSTEKTLLDAGRNSPINVSNWEKYTTDNPYLFRAYRVAQYEDVKKGAAGIGMKPDGRIYTFDFTKHWRSGEQVKEGESYGQLRVSCERAEMEHGRNFQDWRVTLTPVDGGIQMTDNIYMNEAPETGYQPTITVEQRIDDPEYKNMIINQRYFFTAHHSDIYGSLFIHYKPHFRNEKCNIRIAYKMNMEGSRNLAVKIKQY